MHRDREDIGETKEDIEILLSEHSKLIVKNVVKTGDVDAEIFLIEPKLPEDFKAFAQRLVMLINEMGAEEVIYRPEKNSITFWWH